MMKICSKTCSGFSKRTHGQAIVLGALTILLAVVCLFMTIGVTWQIRSRIQLQQVADARAFTDGVKTARLYNSLAYANRAIAGNVVAMTILHSFHTEIAAAADIYWGLFEIYSEAFSMEIAKSVQCFVWFCITCFKFPHCFPHAFINILPQMIKAIAYWASGRMGNVIRGTDKSFQDAIKATMACNQVLTGIEVAMWGQLEGIGAGISSLGAGDSKIDGYNMKTAKSMGRSVDLATSSNIETKVKKKKIEMTDIINASRPLWVRNRADSELTTVVLMPLANQYIKNNLSYWSGGIILQSPYVEGGSAFYASSNEPSEFFPGLINGLTGANSKTGVEGRSVGSYDSYTLTGIVDGGCKMPGVAQMPFLGALSPGWMISKDSGSDHTGGILSSALNKVHSGQHNIKLSKGSGLPTVTEGPFGFISYRNDSSKNDGFGQPKLYGGAQTKSGYSLSNAPDEESNKKYPWDLEFSNVYLDSENASVNLRNNDKAKAASKVLVYYHHPGNWVEPPNFWAPFWHAKLDKVELADVVGLGFVGAADAVEGIVR